jgi:hypothetical protein
MHNWAIVSNATSAEGVLMYLIAPRQRFGMRIVLNETAQGENEFATSVLYNQPIFDRNSFFVW